MMSNFAGNWDCSVKSPLGDMKSVMTVAVDGDTWTGTSLNTEGVVIACDDGAIDGDAVSWSMKISSPMPMTIKCSAIVDGDTMVGTAKAGAFGSFPLTGARAV